MRPIIYWGMIALLGTIHLHALLMNVPFHIPIYITITLVFGIIYFLYKRILLRIHSLGAKGNGLLFGMQGLLILFYFSGKPTWMHVIPFGIFLCIEMFRHNHSKKLSTLSKELNDLTVQQEQFNETFRIVRSERHDFLKHISALHFIFENENHEKAKDYLLQLVEGYEETNLSIKGERGVVAGILHQMYRRAKAAGVEVIYDLDIPLSTLPLSDKDIVTLVGNLLSNSIDACEEWQRKNKKQAHLTLQFYKRSGLFLLICINDSIPIPTNILDELYESYGNTTKGEGHEGLGTKLIHDVVNKHRGFLDFVHKDEEFTVKIKIPAILS